MAPALLISKPRCVLVIGGGSGIGLKAVEYLVSKTNCNVFVSTLIVDSECKQLEARYVGRLLVHSGDVTSSVDLQSAVDQAVERLGGIDSLLYCAGLLYVETCARVDIERVKKVFEVNVLGAIATTQLVLPYLRASSLPARIVFISSGADSGITNCGWMSYCSSKAALSRFIECLAHEEDGTRIKVQGVYPRVTRTPMTPDMIAGNYKGIMRDEEIQKFLDWDKEGTRIEPPHWCGNAVAALVADMVEGSKHGQCVYYDKQVPLRIYKL